MDKRDVYALQAADVFAWNFTRNYYEVYVLKTGMRPQMRELLKPKPERFDVRFLTGDNLKRFIEQTASQEWLNPKAKRAYAKKLRKPQFRSGDASSST